MIRYMIGMTATVCLLFFTTAVSMGEKIPEKLDLEKKLIERITNFDQQMVDGSKQEKIKAVKDLLPTKADIQILFPNDVDAVWGDVEKTRNRFTDNVERISAQIKQWSADTKRTAIDARTEKQENHHQEVLAIIPKEIPVYRVKYEGKINGEMDSDTLNTFLYLNDRWVYFFGFRSIPRLIDSGKP